MYRGLLLDNCGIGERVPDSSIDKLGLMGATAVGTLWTGGTHHGRDVYERCEGALERPFYIVRVGGHRQTAVEWPLDALLAVEAVPLRAAGRVVLTFGNEPNIEGWGDDPAGYGAAYKEVAPYAGVPVLFACPSFGLDGWLDWLDEAWEAAGRPVMGSANLYAGNVAAAWELRRRFGELYVGEVNSAAGVRGEDRRRFLVGAFAELERAGVRCALVFIAGGKSNGAWDERYIVTGEEVAGLALHPSPTAVKGEGLGSPAASGAEASVTKVGTSPAAPGEASVPKGGKVPHPPFGGQVPGDKLFRIGNLDVLDYRAALPDEAGKMAAVSFTVKDFISVHHTATPATATARAIYDYHKSLGWGGIGYNFLVYEDGRIDYVGECNTVRAAVGQITTGNYRGLHVALVGDYREAWPPRAMLEAARVLIANIQQAYGWWLPVVPHRLFNRGLEWDTQCPGALWREWWPKVLRSVGE